MQRRWGWLLVAVPIVVGWWIWRPRPVEVRTATVTAGPLRVEVIATGEVESVRADLSPTRPGRVTALWVEEGDEVTEGQVLARLQDEENAAAVQAAESALRAAEQRAEELRLAWQAALASASSQQAQARALVKGAQAREREVRSGPRSETVRQARALVQEADAAIEAGRARWDQALAALEQARLTYQATSEQADAALQGAEARLARLQAGARAEEKEQAAAAVRAAQASLEYARQNRDRMVRLYEQDAVAKVAVEQAEAQWQNSRSQWEVARERLRLLEAGPHPDDLRAAQAEVAAARGQQQQAAALGRQIAVYEKEEAAAHAQLKVAEAQRAAAEQNLRQLERGARPEERQAVAADVEHTHGLLKQANAARQQADVYQKQYRAARAAVEQARAQVALARAQWRETEITAPMAGLVARRHIEPGEFLVPGQTAFTLINPDARWVVARVDDEDVGKLRLGDELEITSRAYPDRRFRGEVVDIGRLAEPKERLSERARIVRVKVRVEDPARLLKPGMEVDVRGEPLLKRDVLLVPNDALLEEGEETAVWVVKDRRAYRQPVETGFESDQATEVRAGLRPGDRVVVGGKQNLRDGQVVRVRP